MNIGEEPDGGKLHVRFCEGCSRSLTLVNGNLLTKGRDLDMSTQQIINLFSCKKLWRKLWANRLLYLMLMPVLANFIIFHYVPMYGLQIAFKRYNLVLGLSGSPWIGWENFRKFFASAYIIQLFRNTLIISIYSIFLFPLPIILALLLNEVRHLWYKKMVQTVTYLPHFISSVIMVGIVRIIFSSDGIVNIFLERVFQQTHDFLASPKYFRSIYLGLQVWQGTGFSSIIYLSAITAIDIQLYEAAKIDGAGRLKCMWNITLPEIMPTIAIILILRIGSILNVSWQDILLLQNGRNEVVSEVIQTFVYKRGIIEANYGYASAVGFFQSVVAFILIIIANKIAKIINPDYSIF